MSDVPTPATVFSWSAIVPWWGAVLSTALAAVKGFELWRDRFRIRTSYSLTTDAERGNGVSILNLSGRPVILQHWELLRGTTCWFDRRLTPLTDNVAMHDEPASHRIDAYDTHTITLADEYHFDWGPKALQGQSIYLRLYIAGRRPILKKVYSDSN